VVEIRASVDAMGIVVAEDEKQQMVAETKAAAKLSTEQAATANAVHHDDSSESLRAIEVKEAREKQAMREKLERMGQAYIAQKEADARKRQLAKEAGKNLEKGQVRKETARMSVRITIPPQPVRRDLEPPVMRGRGMVSGYSLDDHVC
jgi:hypothetical protein